MKRVLMCAVLIAWSGMASAVVYKWVDQQGKIQYGDRPPDGVNAEVVELLGTHAAATTSARASAPASGAPPGAAKGAATDPATRDPVKKAVDEDVAQARVKQCEEAQERYKKLVEGRHLYKTGENGERQYLTAEEIDSERLNTKRDVDEVCGGAPSSAPGGPSPAEPPSAT